MATNKVSDMKNSIVIFSDTTKFFEKRQKFMRIVWRMKAPRVKLKEPHTSARGCSWKASGDRVSANLLSRNLSLLFLSQ